MLLIIENDPRLHMDLRFGFYYHFSFNCRAVNESGVEEALASFPIRAIYIPHGETLEKPHELCAALKEKHPSIPVVIVLPRGRAGSHLLSLKKEVAALARAPISLPRAAKLIVDARSEKEGCNRASYTREGLDIICGCRHIAFGAGCFNVTTHMLSILNYLIDVDDRFVPTAELAANTGNPRHENRSPATIATRIYELNRLAKQHSEAPIIISNPSKGYALYYKNPRP